MALDFLRLGDCSFYGPALPEPYVRFELEKALNKHKLLPDSDGLAGQALRSQWDILRRKLRAVSPTSGPVALTNRILEPLASYLGFAKPAAAASVMTREGDEAGGVLMTTEAGAKLRCWAVDYDADLEAPTQRGYAYRFSPVRIAQRVLLACGERFGLLTNGVVLRLLLCDPARPDSHIEIDLNVWRLSRDLPDGYQLLLALASPNGIAALPEIVEDARLKQNKVTKELRVQARLAVEEFIQAVLDHPDNATVLADRADKASLAKQLWHEGLVVVYRLLFVLKCESTSDPSRVFRFASASLWRKTYSPSTALAGVVRRVLDEGAPSGRYLEDGLRALFKMFAEGLDHPNLTVRPLGGALFGAQSTPLFSSLRWGEIAVAHLLDRLLWSDTRRGRERVHYGPLDVEDLGRVYEALLELEPGIATQPMCRLRRQKLEVVVPAVQGEKYRNAATSAAPAESPDDNGEDDGGEDDESQEEVEDEKPARGKKTKVEWIEAIAPGRFYLRVGLGRKSSGSYYTPHSFVRFLVQETLGPQCDERSPRDNPNPGSILKLKVLDPACGSGHFLVEACRFLAARVYEAARLCDELATKAEHDAEAEKNAARKQALLDHAADLRQRVKDLPDQEDELLSYLPSRSAGAERAVLSAHDISRAEAICRRLVAVHCLYGADLNPLAVELAKLSLWIESHAEGYPLTFLDHRVVLGNSLTGPFWEKLQQAPGSQHPVSNLFRQNLDLKLSARLIEALSLVKELEASVGVDMQDIAAKQELKRKLDARLRPFRLLAAAWSGGAMLGTDQPDGALRCDDEAYAELLKHVSSSGDIPANMDNLNLQAMIARGLGAAFGEHEASKPGHVVADSRPALPLDLAFPEVFHPTGQPYGRHGFDAVIGNPPWERIEIDPLEFFAGYDVALWDETSIDARAERIRTLQELPEIARAWAKVQSEIEGIFRVTDQLFSHQQIEVEGRKTVGRPDLYRLFAEEFYAVAAPTGVVGWVAPSSLHSAEGAAGIRRLYLDKMRLRCCFSFENRNKLFEIDSRLKFALVVAQKGKATEVFSCAFYLHDDQWLFGDRKDRPPLAYTPEAVRVTGGPYLSFVESRSQQDFELVVSQERAKHTSWAQWLQELKVTTAFGIELHRNPAFRDTLNEQLDAADAIRMAHGARWTWLPICSGKTMFCYTDLWDAGIINRVPIEAAVATRHWGSSVPFYRFAFRMKAASTNERTLVGTIITYGVVCEQTLCVETTPSQRPNVNALLIQAISSAFVFDWQVRQRVTTSLSNYILAPIPIPGIAQLAALLTHCALRLVCNHAGYEPLWREQLGDAWREPAKAPFTWPALAGDDERWVVRAAIDAVVADAYSLSREQYAHVLSTFSHASYRNAPALCVATFDELKAIGLEAFCKKHDPYNDIPLVESLPRPVIDLPSPPEPGAANDGAARGRRKGRTRKSGDGPMLWQERSGQLTLAPPGPLFDPPVPARPAPAAAPDPGMVQAVKTLLELRKVLSRADVREQFGFDAATARKILKMLAEQGLATVEGRGNSARYTLARR